MSVARDVILPARVAAIKLATRRAVEAAGGQALVAAAIGRAQSRVSDYCSLFTADCIPVDLAVEVDAIAEAATGALPIIEMLTRLANSTGATRGGEEHLPKIAVESAELIAALARGAGGVLSSHDVARLMTEGADLHEAVNAFMRDLAAGGGR